MISGNLLYPQFRSKLTNENSDIRKKFYPYSLGYYSYKEEKGGFVFLVTRAPHFNIFLGSASILFIIFFGILFIFVDFFMGLTMLFAGVLFAISFRSLAYARGSRIHFLDIKHVEDQGG